jgi:hypothetical protein
MAQDGEEGIVEPWNNKTSQNSGNKKKKTNNIKEPERYTG